MTAQDRANIFSDDDEDLVLTATVFMYYTTQFFIGEYRSLTGSDVQFALIGSLIVVTLVLSAVFVIGLHKESFKMIYVFYWFSILEVLITLVLLAWETIEIFGRPPWLRSHYLQTSILVQLTLQIVFNTLLPIYFIILIRSELLAIMGEGEQPATTADDEPRVVLDAPVTKQDQRYHFVYSSPEFKHKVNNASPLFPVEELRIERLRQELGQ